MFIWGARTMFVPLLTMNTGPPVKSGEVMREVARSHTKSHAKSREVSREVTREVARSHA